MRISPGKANSLYKLGAFQKYFGQVENIKCKVSKKIFFFIFCGTFQKSAAILLTIFTIKDTHKAMRSKNEFFIFLLAICIYFFSIVTITILLIFTMMVFTKKSNSFDLKRMLERASEFMKKRFQSLSLADKIILVWSLVALVSLFLEWIYFDEVSHNSFHALTGANGFLLCILILLLMASTFSIHYKQKLKLYSGLSFNDYHLAIVVWILLIVLPINSMVFIHGLATLSEAAHGKWIGLSITSWILVFAWALIKKRSMNTSDMSLYMSPSEIDQVDTQQSQPRDNMKLPF